MISCAFSSLRISLMATRAEWASKRPTTTRPIAPSPPVIRMFLPSRQLLANVDTLHPDVVIRADLIMAALRTFTEQIARCCCNSFVLLKDILQLRRNYKGYRFGLPTLWRHTRAWHRR